MIVNNVALTSFDTIIRAIEDQVKIVEAVYAGT